jgi:hypothetical protein
MVWMGAEDGQPPGAVRAASAEQQQVSANE